MPLVHIADLSKAFAAGKADVPYKAFELKNECVRVCRMAEPKGEYIKGHVDSRGALCTLINTLVKGAYKQDRLPENKNIPAETATEEPETAAPPFPVPKDEPRPF